MLNIDLPDPNLVHECGPFQAISRNRPPLPASSLYHPSPGLSSLGAIFMDALLFPSNPTQKLTGCRLCGQVCARCWGWGKKVGMKPSSPSWKIDWRLCQRARTMSYHPWFGWGFHKLFFRAAPGWCGLPRVRGPQIICANVTVCQSGRGEGCCWGTEFFFLGLEEWQADVEIGTVRGLLGARTETARLCYV